MSSLLSVPPAVVLAAVALLVLFVPQRAAHGVGAATLGGLFAWAWIVPDGTGPAVEFVGFDLLLVAVDDVSRFLVLLFCGFGVLAVGFAAATGTDRFRLAVGLGYVAAAISVVLAGDWLAVAIAWAVLVVLATGLAWLAGGRAVRAGYRFALVHAVGGGLFLAGVAFQAVAAGGGGEALHLDGTGIAAGFPALAVGIAAAIGVGVVGFHVWLPEVLSIPRVEGGPDAGTTARAVTASSTTTTPRTVTAPHVATPVFLSVYTTSTAVYVVYRAFPDGTAAFAYLGAAMAVYGGIFGLLQWDLHWLSAYQLQAQVGIALVGIGLGSPLSGFTHLFVAVVAIGLLFVLTGGLRLRVGTGRINRLGGLVRSDPATVAAVAVAAFAVVGAPGFGGFASVGLVVSAVDAADATLLRWPLLAALVVTAATFAKVGRGFLRGERPETDVRGPGRGEATVVFVLVVASVVPGVFPGAVSGVLSAADGLPEFYSVARLLEATAVVAAGVVAYAVLASLLERTDGDLDVDRLVWPAAVAVVAVAATGTGRVSNAVDSRVGNIGVAAARAVRDPGGAIESAIPARFRDQYRERRARAIGATGTKLGIEGSIYVLVALLAVALAFGLR